MQMYLLWSCSALCLCNMEQGVFNKMIQKIAYTDMQKCYLSRNKGQSTLFSASIYVYDQKKKKKKIFMLFCAILILNP